MSNTVNLSEKPYRLDLLSGTDSPLAGPRESLPFMKDSFRLLQIRFDVELAETHLSFTESEGEIRGHIVTVDRELNKVMRIVKVSGAEICAVDGDEASELARNMAEDYGWDID